MFVRLTHFTLPAEKVEEIKNVYYTEVGPVIERQPGIVNVLLLEPTDGSNEFISCTTWNTESDTKTFESSEVYGEVFGKIKAATVSAPYQKYYHSGAIEK